MSTHRALVLSSFDKPIALETVPTPSATPGTALVRILATGIVPYMRQVLNGTRQYPLKFPMTPGSNAIARIISVGPDAISLNEGQLVLFDCTARARDDPGTSMLMGLHAGSGPAQKLMEGEWRNSTWQEVAKVPLENVYPLDEAKLCKQMGYSFVELTHLAGCLVPFGGLDEIELGPGQTLIVAPATGKFGGAAVAVGLAMGARVVALGRNKGILGRMEQIFGAQYPPGRFLTVPISGNDSPEAVQADTSALVTAIGGTNSSAAAADAYIDFSPSEAAKSPHITMCLSALRPFGRMALMGGIISEISIPYPLIMFKSLRIQGRFMYERRQVETLVKMAEAGNLRLGSTEEGSGVEIKGTVGLEGIERGMELAEEEKNWGAAVVLEP